MAFTPVGPQSLTGGHGCSLPFECLQAFPQITFDGTIPSPQTLAQASSMGHPVQLETDPESGQPARKKPFTDVGGQEENKYFSGSILSNEGGEKGTT